MNRERERQMFKMFSESYKTEKEIERLDSRLSKYKSIKSIRKFVYNYGSKSNRYVYRDSDHFAVTLDESEYIEECLTGCNIKEEIKRIDDTEVIYSF